jgi:hypothetical protein
MMLLIISYTQHHGSEGVKKLAAPSSPKTIENDGKNDTLLTYCDKKKR